MLGQISKLSNISNFQKSTTKIDAVSLNKISFKGQPEADVFIGSNLSNKQKIEYLKAKQEHTDKGKAPSFFTQVYNHKVPGKEPVLVIKRDGKVNVGVILDGYPVNRGHALIVPKRQIGSIFDTTPEERQDIFTALEQYKKMLEDKLAENGLPLPVAYNIGINDGFAAGQTVPHLHVQVIPRYFGDVPNPRGGVRGVKGVEENIPYENQQWGKQKYSGPPDDRV